MLVTESCRGAKIEVFGIKADSTFAINGGELRLKSTGSGGKGINVDMEAFFNGGSVYVVTSGGQYQSNNDISDLRLFHDLS